MKTTIASGPHSFDDFCALVKDGQKADLINGVIYMASPDNTKANKLTGWLSRLMADVADATDAGDIFICRVALRLDDRNGPEPDIAFVRKVRLHLVKPGHIAGPADLALEIVSPESIERDYEKKRLQYQDAGIPEYWIVDEMLEKVTQLVLGAGGKYREVKPRRGEIHSRALPGFWIRPEWLWQEPLPKKSAILAQIMARLS